MDECKIIKIETTPTKQWSFEKHKRLGIKLMSDKETGLIFVNTVEASSPAWRSGIRYHDVIVFYGADHVPVCQDPKTKEDIFSYISDCISKKVPVVIGFKKFAEAKRLIQLQQHVLSVPSVLMTPTKKTSESAKCNNQKIEHISRKSRFLNTSNEKTPFDCPCTYNNNRINDTKLKHLKRRRNHYYSQPTVLKRDDISITSDSRRFHENKHSFVLSERNKDHSSCSSQPSAQRRSRPEIVRKTYASQSPLERHKIFMKSTQHRLLPEITDPVSKIRREEQNLNSHARRRATLSDSTHELESCCDRIRKALAKESLNEKEHAEFVLEQSLYFKRWYQSMKASSQTEELLKLMTQFWSQYWETRSEEVKTVYRDEMSKKKKPKRSSKTDVQQEISNYFRVQKRRFAEKTETNDERFARLYISDQQRIERRNKIALKQIDPVGLADYLHEHRMLRARQQAQKVAHAELLNRPFPKTTTEKQQWDNDWALWFGAQTVDSPSRVCICCEQLFFTFQVQNFKKRSMDLLQATRDTLLPILSEEQIKLADMQKHDSIFDNDKLEEIKHVQNIINQLLNMKSAIDDIEERYSLAKDFALMNPRVWGDPDEPTLNICKHCWCTNFLKDKPPPRGSWNNLKLDEIPPNLASLPELGVRLLARRLPFQTIIPLPRGGQKGLKGGLINIPANVQGTADRLLPHNLSSGGLIPISLKKKLAYNKSHGAQCIHVPAFFKALEELVANSKHYANLQIKTSETWLLEVQEEDSEFYRSFVNEDQKQCDPNSNSELDDDDSDESDSNETPFISAQNPITDTLLMNVNGPVLGDINDLAEENQATRTGAKRDHRRGVNVAPGEGQNPLSILKDKEVEELAYPREFPKGRGSWYCPDRPIRLTLSEYTRCRILSADRRFVSNPSYLFFSLNRLQTQQIFESIAVSLNKRSLENEEGLCLNDYMTGNIKEFFTSGALDAFIAKDGGFRWMKKIRGSPAYWKTELYNVIAMVRQLGTPHLFLTLSSNDMGWYSVIRPMYETEFKRHLSESAFEALSGRTKAFLLRKYPDIAARHFYQRVKLFFKKFLGSKNSPIGYKMIDFMYRFEWQQRGSPHVHCIIWLEALPGNPPIPILGKDSDEDFVAFANTLVTCSKPDREKDPQLYDVVCKTQSHKHTFTCQRKGNIKLTTDEKKLDKFQQSKKIQDKLCRFSYPKPITPATYLKYSDTKNEGSTSQQIPTEASEPCQTRDNSNQTSHVELVMERQEGSESINNYNPTIIKSWGGNMDIQVVTNAYAAVQYICSYISKAEKELAEAMTQIVKEIPDDADIMTRMRQIGNAFINTRSVSAQEAIHLLISLALVMKSRGCIFVPTGFPNKRHRMMKTAAEILNLVGIIKTEDLFRDGILQKYEARTCYDKDGNYHSSIKTLCLADFAAEYSSVSVAEDEIFGDGEKNGVDSELDPPNVEDMDEAEDDDNCQEEDITTNDELPATSVTDLPATISLGKLGIVKRRTKRAIVRYFRFDPSTEPEVSAYSHLLLFRYFQTESLDMLLEEKSYSSYTEWLKAEWDIVKENAEKYEPYSDIVEEAFKNFGNKQTDERLTDLYGAAGDDGGIDGSDDDRDLNDFFLTTDDIEGQEDIFAGLGENHEDGPLRDPPPPDFEVQTGFGSSSLGELIEELDQKVAKLNVDQKEAFNTVCDTIHEYKYCLTNGISFNGKPLFITGPGGTGKSFVLRVCQLKLQIELQKNLSDLVSVVMAPTGSAAMNVGGDTIHHALHIPIVQSRAAASMGISDRMLQILKTKYKASHAWLIDEISMVSSNMLFFINSRLNSITGTVDPNVYFGGMIIIFFGDFHQLNPVLAHRPYTKPSINVVGAGAAGINLWQALVEMIELTIIERQKGDQAWAELLNRVRLGIHTDADIATLISRTLEALHLNKNDPEVVNLLHIFWTRAEVDEFNAVKMNELRANRLAEKETTSDTFEVSITVNAKDDFDHKTTEMTKNRYTGNFEALFPADPDKTGGLSGTLEFIKGERVVLKRNIDVSDNMVNGSMGTVMGWSRTTDVKTGLPHCVYIQFDEIMGQPIGLATCRKHACLMPRIAKERVVPIVPVVATFKSVNKKFFLKRKMFPLKIAFGMTIHSCQGKTVKKIAVTLKDIAMPNAMAYVSLSRVTSIKGLYLLDFNPGCIKVDIAAAVEMNRLRSKAGKNQLPLPVSAKHRAVTQTGSKMTVKNPTSKKRCMKVTFLDSVSKDIQETVAKSPRLTDNSCRPIVIITEQGSHSFDWIIDNFIIQNASYSDAELDFRISQTENQLKSRPDLLCDALEFVRSLSTIWYESRDISTVKPCTVTQELLFSCLLHNLKPVMSTPDGNCMFHSLAILLLGHHSSRFHLVLRGLAFAFCIIFEDHLKFLIYSETDGQISDMDRDERYRTICRDIATNQSFGEKEALYACSWITGRSIIVFTPCYKWNSELRVFDFKQPRGSVELENNISALRAAFAHCATETSRLAVNVDLPYITEVRTVTSDTELLPLCIFLHLHQQHYCPLMMSSGTRVDEIIKPFLCEWKYILRSALMLFPLASTSRELRQHIEDI